MEKLIKQIFSDKKIVVITGAGISTLSGIPDFRGNNGLYKKFNNAEYMLSLECFQEEPEEFYTFYKSNMIFKNIKPNITHETLAKLEEKGFIDCIITQNIDGLHQKAGSRNVVELHGNGDTFYCRKCAKKYDISRYVNNGYFCDRCNGIIRPDIVLYGESVKRKDYLIALKKIIEADTVIVLGSSLTVSTINNLLNEYIRINKINNSDKLIIINDNETIYDKYGIRYKDNLEKVFKKIKRFNDQINNLI